MVVSFQCFSQKRFTGLANDLWSNSLNWNPSGVPISTDDIIINCNTNPILDANVTVKSITFDNAADQASTLNIGNYILSVTNSVNLTDPFGSSGDQSIVIGAGILVTDSLMMANTSTASEDLEVSISTGRLTVNKLIQMSGATTENNLKISSSGKIQLGGEIGVDGNLDFHSSSIFEYISTSAQSIRGASYANLTIKNNSIKTLGGTTTVSGALLIESSATLNLSSSSFTVSGISTIQGTLSDDNTSGTNTFQDSVAIQSTGSWNITVAESFSFSKSLYVEGSFVAGAGTYTFSGSNSQIAGTTALSFSGNITLSGSIYFTNNTNLTISSAATFSGSSATFINNDTLYVNTNNFTVDSLIAANTGNAVIYNNSGNVTAVSTVYYNLEKQNTGILTIDSGVTVINHFEIDAGTVQCNYTMEAFASTTAVLRNGATIILGSTSVTRDVSFLSNIPAGNVIQGNSFTFSLNANGSSIITEDLNYGNLTITTGSSNKVISASKDIRVRGTLALNNSTGTVTLQVNSSTLDVDGSITGAGNIEITTGELKVGGSYSNTGALTYGTGTVTYDGTSSQSIKAGGYYNLVLTGNSSKTPLSNITVYKDLTIASGSTFAISSNTMNTQGTMYINGTFTDDNTGGTNTIDSVVISSTGVWNCTVAENFTIAGYMSNAGSFTSGSGTYVMSGSKTIVGDFVFSGNLQVNTGVTVQNTDSVWVGGNITGFSPATSVWTNLSNSYLNCTGSILSTGTLNATSTGNTVHYSNASSFAAKSTNYYHLRKSGTGTLTFSSANTISGNITVTQGTLLCAATLIGTASSVLTVESGAILALGQTSSSTDVLFPTNILESNMILHSNSTIQFNTNGTQTFNTTVDYGGISIGTGSTTKTFTPGANFKLRGALTLNETSGDVLFSMTSNRLEVDGTLAGSGDLTFTSGSFYLGGSSSAHTGTLTYGDTLVLDGSSAQTIRGGTLKNLVLNNSSGATLNESMSITSSCIIQNGILSGGNNLTLVSNSSGTARIVGPAAGGYITGNVTVQRFIPAASQRRYRCISSPIQTTNFSQFIDDILVTGTGGDTNGFDNSPTNWSSIYTYRELTSGSGRGWHGCSNITNSINQAQGMLVYVRGDRSVSSPYSTSSPSNDVTIDFVGTINQGNIASSLTYTNTGNPSDDGWNLVGNPYPCPIDWTALTQSNLSSFYYILDPSTGSYVADNGANTIASGQAFFVQANAASPVLGFRESAKTATNPVSYFKSAASGVKLLLRKDSFNSDYLKIIPGGSNLYLPTEDATKLTNQVMNIYTRSLDSIPLQINMCTPNLSLADTISIYVHGPNGNYTLQLQEDNWVQVADLLLYDKITNLTINLRQNQSYNFSITGSNGNIHNRFALIVRGGSTLPIDLFNLNGKPIVSNDEYTEYELEWSVLTSHETEGYTLSYATNANNWIDERYIATARNNAESYKACVKVKEPHNNAYFSIKSQDVNGISCYSNILVLNKETIRLQDEIQIFPNPVEDYFYIKSSSNMVIPILRIYDSMGVEVYKQFNIRSKDSINLTHLKPGIYFIRQGINHFSFLKK